MKQGAKKTKRGHRRMAEQPPTTFISAAWDNARYTGPTNSSIPSSLRKFEAAILDSTISDAASTEAIVVDDKGRPVSWMSRRRHSDNAYPAVRGRRGTSPSPHAEPGAEKLSATFWLLLGMAIVLTASVGGILNMMLKTAYSEDSEPLHREQPKQAASPLSTNHSGISTPDGTTADNAKATTPTKFNEDSGNPHIVTVHKPTWHSDGAVDNTSLGSINMAKPHGNEGVGSNDGAAQEMPGRTSQGIVRGKVRSDADTPAEIWNRTVLQSSMATGVDPKQTTPNLDRLANTVNRKKLSIRQRITQVVPKSSQHKTAGISVAFAESVTAGRSVRGNQDGAGRPFTTTDRGLWVPEI